MKRLRILALAPGANPDSLSTALVGYAHAEALAGLHAVTLVVNEKARMVILNRNAGFHEIVGVQTPLLDFIYGWIVRHVFKGDYGSHLLTAISYPFCVMFEWKAWRLLRRRIAAGEFDVALRLLPVVPTLPSAFGSFLRGGPIPFVIGPINGGLPWPKGFMQAERQKEWITRFRNFYRFLPFGRSSYRNAKAIVAGSSETCREFSAYADKVFFLPENGLSKSLLSSASSAKKQGGPLDLVYLGRLVPYKACDLAIRGAAPLVRSGRAKLTIIGDGPEHLALQQLAKSLQVESGVVFAGWLSHAEAMQRLERADILLFPSIREFGGGVVFEALALGAVPIVADFGGPGDIVTPDVGYRIAVTNENDMVAEIEKVLLNLAERSDHLAGLQQRGRRYALEQLSWDGKALIMTQVLLWATGQGPKPVLLPPKSMREDVH